MIVSQVVILSQAGVVIFFTSGVFILLLVPCSNFFTGSEWSVFYSPRVVTISVVRGGNFSIGLGGNFCTGLG